MLPKNLILTKKNRATAIPIRVAVAIKIKTRILRTAMTNRVKNRTNPAFSASIAKETTTRLKRAALWHVKTARRATKIIPKNRTASLKQKIQIRQRQSHSLASKINKMSLYQVPTRLCLSGHNQWCYSRTII